ncbi:MAG: hypothetical protein FJ265_11885 [Planctomycetes bacterium]|nr:hypothetical protein [Planctomycetota bacterium]
MKPTTTACAALLGHALAALPAQTGTLTTMPSGGTPQYYGPSLRASVAFDGPRNRLVLLNSLLLGAGTATYEYDFTSWTLRSQLGAPPGPQTTASNLAYDEVRQRCLVATSTGFTVYLSAWTPGGWQVLASVPLQPAMPAGGVPLALARDPLRDRTVLVAGSPGSTYEYDGAQLLASGPGPGVAGTAAFDPARGQVIATTYNSTWVYDGTGWTDLRAGPYGSTLQLAHDPVGGRVLATCDVGLAEWQSLGWAHWRDALLLGGSLPDAPRLLAVDPATGDVWIVALAYNGAPGGTFRYRELPPVPGGFTFLGAGCSGPLGTPGWAPPGDPPRLGRPFYSALHFVPGGAPNATPVVVVVGLDVPAWGGQPLPLSLAPFGAPGCRLFAEPAFAMPLGTATNLALCVLPMPADTNALGLRFRMQAILWVPGWNALGAIASDAMTGTIGTR